LVLRTLAVADMTMVTGSGPQLNVMRPPAETAATTASDVQLPAVPVPITRVGCEVSTARASTGTLACPFGFPTGGPGGGAVVAVAAVGCGLGTDVVGAGRPDDDRADGPPADPQPATATSTARVSGIDPDLKRTHEW
jgi:hypothetical protein